MQIELTAARATTADAKLTIAAEKQEVTVAETTHLELDPSKNAGQLVLSGQDLDMLSDDPDDLQNDLTALAGPAAGPNGGQIFVDGFSNGQLPPKDSIREIRINSNPFSAEFDHIGFGRIEILTKPGTDKLHGTIFYQTDDGALDARNPYATQQAVFPHASSFRATSAARSIRKLRFSSILVTGIRTNRRWSKPPSSVPISCRSR